MTAPPPPNRVRSLLFTVASGQGLAVVTMAVGFVATPWLLQYLGAERFGVWRVLEVLLAYLGVAPQCVAQAVGYLMVARLADGDPVRVRRLLTTGVLTAAGLMTLTALVGVAALPLLGWVVPTTPDLEGERGWAFLLAVLLALPFAPWHLLRVHFEAAQKGYVSHAAVGVQSLTLTALGLSLAAAGWGLAGQAVAVAGAGAVLSVLLFALCVRALPGVLRVRPTRDEARTVLTRTGKLLLLGVLGAVAARVEYLVVNGVDGAAATTRYALGQRLFLVYAGLVATLANGLWVPLLDLLHRGEREHFRGRFGLAVRVTVVAGLAGAGVIAAVTGHFLRLWVGEGQDPGLPTRVAFALTFPLAGLNVLLTWLLTADGRHRLMLVCVSAYCGATVALTLALGWWFGAVGVAWGMAGGAATAAVVNLLACRRAFALELRPLARPLLIAVALAVACGVGCTLAVSYLAEVGWVGLLAILAGGWGTYVALAWVLVFRTEERGEVLNRILRR